MRSNCSICALAHDPAVSLVCASKHMLKGRLNMSHAGIAVGLDGSPECEHAVAWAAMRAQLLGCPLTLLTVVDSAVLGKCGVDAEDFLNSIQDSQNETKSELELKYPQLRVLTQIKVGKFVKTLIEAGSAYDLLVLGKAENSLESILGGSPAVRFSSVSNTPCAVIPKDWEEALSNPDMSIVVGVGPDVDVSGAAIMFAAQEAYDMGAELRLVSSWGLPEWLEKSAGVLGGGASAAGSERQQELNYIASKLLRLFPNLKISCHCVEGTSTKSALAGISKDSLMLVLGTNGRSMAGRALFGSATYETLLHPGVPVVVVPPRYGDRVGSYHAGDFVCDYEDYIPQTNVGSPVAAH